MSSFFFFNATAPPEIYTLSLHDALPISNCGRCARLSDDGEGASAGRQRHQRAWPGRQVGRSMLPADAPSDRKSTRLNSSHRCISYAVFCLKKKKKTKKKNSIK